MTWDPFQQPEELEATARLALEQQQQEQDELRYLQRATFNTPAGQALIRAWQRELQAPAYRPGDTLDAVALREGRRDLMREIIQATERKD